MLEIVVVGTGDKSSCLDPEIQSYLRKHYISLEVQDTVSCFPLKFSAPNVLSLKTCSSCSQCLLFPYFVLQANAAATFNFLLEERRLVGAALIPPKSIVEH